MGFDVRVIKTLIQIVESEIDICSEFFKPLVHVGGEVVESFVHGVEAFVDVGGEVVKAIVYSFKAFVHRFEPDVHCALQPINL